MDKNVVQRDLQMAKEAFESGDTELSIKAHKVHLQKENHGGKVSEYLENIVFGGLDGIITTFAVVVAAVASHISYGTILIIVFANLLGDSIGMAIGDYLSSKAEEDHEKTQRRKEQWEIENVPEIEKKEMIDIYKKKGMSEIDAKTVVDLLFESKKAFLDVMMIEELEIMPTESEGSAWKGALVTFFAFIVLGGLPTLPYLFSTKYTQRAELDVVFWIAIALFALVLYILGAVKGKITGKKKWWFSGFVMLINGGITTTISYFVGWGLQDLAS